MKDEKNKVEALQWLDEACDEIKWKNMDLRKKR